MGFLCHGHHREFITRVMRLLLSLFCLQIMLVTWTCGKYSFNIFFLMYLWFFYWNFFLLLRYICPDRDSSTQECLCNNPLTMVRDELYGGPNVSCDNIYYAESDWWVEIWYSILSQYSFIAWLFFFVNEGPKVPWKSILCQWSKPV